MLTSNFFTMKQSFLTASRKNSCKFNTALNLIAGTFADSLFVPLKDAKNFT